MNAEEEDANLYERAFLSFNPTRLKWQVNQMFTDDSKQPNKFASSWQTKSHKRKAEILHHTEYINSSNNAKRLNPVQKLQSYGGVSIEQTNSLTVLGNSSDNNEFYTREN